ncbi:MAG: hypothetical protein CMB47_05070 [Euryarchaeota archaeon]|nr:hypothetical protein [Euryarchaeota archaeon]|tara:strand:- start:3493 stop:3756 length:264 start_codon:yes stop_codon:yes gene_type:complete
MIDMSDNNLRTSIKKYLTKKPRNTAEIYSWLSKKNILPNYDVAELLESDDSIVRIGVVRKSGMIDKKYPLSEWATEEWVKYHERSIK